MPGNPLQYPCLENPMDGGAWCTLLSMGSQRVGHDWATSLSFPLSLSMHLTSCFTIRFSQVALVIKNLIVNAGDTGDVDWISESGRSPRGGRGNPLQYSCLENPMDREAWRATVHGVTKSWTWLKLLSMHAHTQCGTSYNSHFLDRKIEVQFLLLIDWKSVLTYKYLS